MRFKNYYSASAVGKPELMQFTAEDFKEAGLMYAEAGIPMLEALELVNKFNEVGRGKCSYWLGEGQ